MRIVFAAAAAGDVENKWRVQRFVCPLSCWWVTVEIYTRDKTAAHNKNICNDALKFFFYLGHRSSWERVGLLRKVCDPVSVNENINSWTKKGKKALFGWVKHLSRLPSHKTHTHTHTDPAIDESCGLEDDKEGKLVAWSETYLACLELEHARENPPYGGQLWEKPYVEWVHYGPTLTSSSS